jgi:hypothetical protein
MKTNAPTPDMTRQHKAELASLTKQQEQLTKATAARCKATDKAGLKHHDALNRVTLAKSAFVKAKASALVAGADYRVAKRLQGANARDLKTIGTIAKRIAILNQRLGLTEVESGK